MSPEIKYLFCHLCLFGAQYNDLQSSLSNLSVKYILSSQLFIVVYQISGSEVLLHVFYRCYFMIFCQNTIWMQIFLTRIVIYLHEICFLIHLQLLTIMK